MVVEPGSESSSSSSGGGLTMVGPGAVDVTVTGSLFTGGGFCGGFAGED